VSARGRRAAGGEAALDALARAVAGRHGGGRDADRRPDRQHGDHVVDELLAEPDSGVEPGRDDVGQRRADRRRGADAGDGATEPRGRRPEDRAGDVPAAMRLIVRAGFPRGSLAGIGVRLPVSRRPRRTPRPVSGPRRP